MTGYYLVSYAHASFAIALLEIGGAVLRQAVQIVQANMLATSFGRGPYDGF